MTETVSCPSCHAPVHVVVPPPSAPPGTAGWVVLLLLLLLGILGSSIYAALATHTITTYLG